MDDLKAFGCQNPDCPDYGRRGLDNLRVCFHNGPNNTRRVPARRTCQKRFSERKGAALYPCKLAEDRALAVLHVAFDPEHRLVVGVIPGKRREDHVHLPVQDFKKRSGGRLMNLMTSDEYPAYRAAIFAAYATVRQPPRTGRPGRPKKPVRAPPKRPKYATVHKGRKNGRW